MSSPSRLASLSMLLPPDERQRGQCLDCVTQRLQGRPGIRRVQLQRDPAASETATLLLDYDPQLVTLAALEREVANAKACLDPNLAHLILKVDGMHSIDAERLIERQLFGLPSVHASANYSAGTLRLEFDRRQCPLPEIVRRLDRLGYRAHTLAPSSEPLRLQRTPTLARRFASARNWALSHVELSLVLVGGLLLILGFLAGLMAPEGAAWNHPWQIARVALILLSAVCTSTETGPEAWGMLRRLKLDVDLLMFAAAIGAASLGKWEEGALLLFLFGLGSAGEHLALSRARSSIEALAKIAPETATLLKGNERTVVSVKEVTEGDLLLVNAFERVPVDGAVHEGTGAIDQSPVTGESVPVEKQVGDDVFAGTINAGSRLIIRCTKPASRSTLARIIQLVEEAQSTRSSTQVFTDKVEHYYVPIVFIATALLILIPPLLHWRTWGIGFYNAMAFLTAASPCALAIGTPAAVLCAIARAARIGVLIKGGVHLENLGTVRALALDKTGTLTTGKLRVSDVVPAPGITEQEVLRLAASVESASTHPLASAVVHHARATIPNIPHADDTEQLPAVGVQGHVEGRLIFAGKPSKLALPPELSQRLQQLKSQGRAIVTVGVDGNAIGLIALADTVRPAASQAIRQLHAVGVRHTVMLTGDHAGSAASVASEVGLDAFHADLLPEDKLRLLTQTARTHGPIAMVGDGVNDAPALASAAVGIAMGGAGSDVAMETADVVLLSDDLSRLPAALALARKARRIIAQNLIIALGVIAIVAPLAALGFTRLSVAVLLHEGSTIVVVLNSLRLLRPTKTTPPTLT